MPQCTVEHTVIVCLRMDLSSCIAQVYAFANMHITTFDILIKALERLKMFGILTEAHHFGYFTDALQPVVH